VRPGVHPANGAALWWQANPLPYPIRSRRRSRPRNRPIRPAVRLRGRRQDENPRANPAIIPQRHSLDSALQLSLATSEAIRSRHCGQHFGLMTDAGIPTQWFTTEVTVPATGSTNLLVAAHTCARTAATGCVHRQKHSSPSGCGVWRPRLPRRREPSRSGA
jgi:hypothetical protein